VLVERHAIKEEHDILIVVRAQHFAAVAAEVELTDSFYLPVVVDNPHHTSTPLRQTRSCVTPFVLSTRSTWNGSPFLLRKRT